MAKATLPVVQEHMGTIQEISKSAFWKAPSMERLEQIREELREVVKNALLSKRDPIIITVDDTMEEKEGERPVIETDYHTRILDYLREHHDNEAINKIYRLEQLSDVDIMELERICWKELGTKEEYEAFINKGQMICGDKVAAFIRSMVGIDIQIAKERFSQFLSDNVLNSLQEEYLNQIIGYVCENGDITPETLMTDDNFRELQWSSVFGPQMISIGKYVNELHNLIA
jgi:type I restriction enzyme R subunit